MDPGLSKLLKWGIEHSSEQSDNASAEPTKPNGGSSLNADILAQLLGGPSDADLMVAAMNAIVDATVTLENKLIAFDNFEQLVETIDNANNIDALGLWTPLIAQLENPEPELRRMAAWCIGTAVQNNPKAQARLLALEAVPTIVRLTLSDPAPNVRQKAAYALSSGIRNYAPSLKVALQLIPQELVGRPVAEVDAGDMGAVDEIMMNVREHTRALHKMDSFISMRHAAEY